MLTYLPFSFLGFRFEDTKEGISNLIWKMFLLSGGDVVCLFLMS